MLIRRISLPLSNVFLITDKKHILVDAGCQGDYSNLVAQIERSGVSVAKISAVVLTHVHFDHCGCAAAFQSVGIPVIAARASQLSLETGSPEGLHFYQQVPKLFRGTTFARNFSGAFPPVRIDYPIDKDCSLGEFGVDGRIIPTPGHTRASLSVCLADGSACIGDLLMGGILGLPPAWKPVQHPWSEDKSACRDQVQALRTMGIRRFFVGHGDTLEARLVDDFLSK